MLDFLKKFHPDHNILIVAPLAIAKSTWADEIKKWDIDIPYTSLILDENGKKLSKKKRLELYQTIRSKKRPHIWFINVDLLVDLIEHTRHKRFPFQTVIIDEFHKFKSAQSKRFKALKSVRHDIKNLYGLTGTPTPQGLEDLYSQMWLLDKGERLGNTLTTFRNWFCNTYPLGTTGRIIYEIKPGADKIIYDRIKDITLSIDKLQNLPEIIYDNRYIELTPEEKRDYKTLAKQYILDIETNNDQEFTIDAVNAGVLYMKLKQLAGGTIYTPDYKEEPLYDEYGNIIYLKELTPEGIWKTTNIPATRKVPIPQDKALNKLKYTVYHKHKLDQLEYIINNCNDNLLICYKFRSDANEILKAFPDCVMFDGSPEMIHNWNDKQYKQMLIHPASAGAGLNLQQGGHSLCWYTLPDSLEEYIQTTGRIYRKGQTQTVFIYTLLVKDTVDAGSLKRLQNKNITQEELIAAVKHEVDVINDNHILGD